MLDVNHTASQSAGRTSGQAWLATCYGRAGLSTKSEPGWGHKPNSDAITHYVSYLAIDRSRSKQKLHQGQLQQAQHQLQEARARERLAGERIRKQEQQLQMMQSAWQDTMEDVRELKGTLELLQRRLQPDMQIS